MSPLDISPFEPTLADSINLWLKLISKIFSELNNVMGSL